MYTIKDPIPFNVSDETMFMHYIDVLSKHPEIKAELTDLETVQSVYRAFSGVTKTVWQKNGTMFLNIKIPCSMNDFYSGKFDIESSVIPELLKFSNSVERRPSLTTFRLTNELLLEVYSLTKTISGYSFIEEKPNTDYKYRYTPSGTLNLGYSTTDVKEWSPFDESNSIALLIPFNISEIVSSDYQIDETAKAATKIFAIDNILTNVEHIKPEYKKRFTEVDNSILIKVMAREPDVKKNYKDFIRKYSTSENLPKKKSLSTKNSHFSYHYADKNRSMYSMNQVFFYPKINGEIKPIIMYTDELASRADPSGLILKKEAELKTLNGVTNFKMYNYYSDTDFNYNDLDNMYDIISPKFIQEFNDDLMNGYTDAGGTIWTATDPQFIDPINENFSLNSYSSCIDKGSMIPGLHDNTEPSIDIEGKLIFNYPDIGAYEYVPGECEYNFDNDNDVDGLDIAIFVGEFGRTNCTTNYCQADVDLDGDVDENDLAILSANFGKTGCNNP